MKILSKLKEIDDNLIDEYVKDINRSDIDIPKRYRSVFCRVSGAAELSYIFRNKFIGDVSDVVVLVVGLHGGRDYWSSVVHAWDVYGMDINECDFPNSQVVNAEGVWPYADQSFDVVIMGEVLEHLFYDKEALKEANRVIKSDGRLIVTVPFYDSNDKFHVRMHDQQTMTHLLHFSGFKVVDSIERPGLFFKSYFNYINSLLSVVAFLFFRVNLYHSIVPFYGELEYFFGKKKLFRRLLKVSAGLNFGGNFVAVKTDDTLDYIDANKMEFEQKVA